LKRVISNNDELVYRCLIHYIAKMIRVGKTKLGLVLMGMKGTGKSTFAILMGWLVSMDYYFLEQDISNLKKEFNGHMENNIVLHIEEVPNEAGEFHKVQEILKTITTEEKQRIRKMRTNPYMGNQVANPIIITNNMNPVKITDDNRRFLILLVAICEINNSKYFKALMKETKENLEFIRHYFYNFEYIDDLNSIRLVTEAEKDLCNLNTSKEIKFMKEAMVLQGNKNDGSRMLDNVYFEYKRFCDNFGGSKKTVNIEYFSKMLKQRGYETLRIKVKGKKNRYVQDRNPDFVDDDNDDDKVDIDMDDDY